jgi:hypothetical protein
LGARLKYKRMLINYKAWETRTAGTLPEKEPLRGRKSEFRKFNMVKSLRLILVPCVRHTEAFFAAAELEATILRHQSNAARVATGFELNNSQDDNKLWLIDVPPHRIRPTV